jgi:multiple RNA-binding domain-containing protein 1
VTTEKEDRKAERGKDHEEGKEGKEGTGGKGFGSPLPQRSIEMQKRKRDALDDSNADPRLKKFLRVMQNRDEEEDRPEIPEADSDSEYEYMPTAERKSPQRESPHQVGGPPAQPSRPDILAQEPLESNYVAGKATDEEWLRSKTSRVLDLMDVDELPTQPATQDRKVPAEEENEEADTVSEVNGKAEPEEKRESPDPKAEPSIEAIQKTSRLFLRNLAYRVTEEDLTECFEKFGKIKQVRSILF